MDATRERRAGLAAGGIPAWIRMDMEWLRIDGGVITEIRSFYDSTRIREVLSPSEQEGLHDGD